MRLLLLSLVCGCCIADPLQAEGSAIEHIRISSQSVSNDWLSDPSNAQPVRWSVHQSPYDAASLFQGVVGFQADSRANFAQDSRLSSRGFGSRSAFGIRGLRLLQDGIPLSAPDGQGQLSSVLLDELEYAEVLTGPLAVLYGNAAGGVIALQSRRPMQDQVTLRWQQSPLLKQHYLSFSQGNASAGGRFSLKQSSLQSERAHSKAEKQQAQWLWFSSLPFAELLVRYDWSRDPRLEDPLALTVSEWRLDPTQTATAALLYDTQKSSRQQQLNVLLSQQHDNTSWQVATWAGKRYINQYLGFEGAAATSAGGIVDLHRPYFGLNGFYQWSWSSLSLTVGSGLEQSTDQRKGYINQHGQPGALRRDDSGTVRSQDWYSRIRYQLSPQWQLNGGLRFSHNKVVVTDHYINAQNPDDGGTRSFRQSSAAAALTYLFNDQASIYLSTGRGFETPTLTEMAYQSDNPGLNLALLPSQSSQWEVGYKWQGSDWFTSLAAFTIQSENEILVDQSNAGRTSYKNAAQTRRQGLEWQLQWQLSAQWRQGLSVSWLDAEFRDPPLLGLLLPGVAKQQLHWHWRYLPEAHPAQQLELNLQLRGPVATTDQNQSFAPGFGRIDLSWAYQVQQLTGLSWQLRADNLTNQRYVGAVVVNQSNGRAFEPALGRQLSLTFSYQW